MGDKPYCAWCGRAHDETRRMFPGPTLYICGDCIGQLSNVAHGEDSALAQQVRDEIDQAVQDGFQRIVEQLSAGPLGDKYQRLMKVKFKEEPGSPTFSEVFDEFKKGVEAEVPGDDFQTRYDLAIAYSEMGLGEDAFREMVGALRGALRQGHFDHAGEIMSALLYMQKDSARAIKAIFRAMGDAGVENG